MKKVKNTKIALFEGKRVRKILYNGEWWFVINDTIEILTGSSDPAQYFKKLKERDKELAKLIAKGGVQFVPPLMLKVETQGGKQKMYCWNTEGILRLIQSVPSPKAEPFKIWLAKVGYERIKEIENPELAAERAREIYLSKGYSKDWIEKRMRGIEVRATLTNEWKDRGAKKGVEYAILTNEILRGTFDMSVEDYKNFKGLSKENLRDHMDDLELILTMLGEATTTRIHKDRDSKGFVKLKEDAQEGGAVAGSTRKDIEKRTGRKIFTKKNFINLSSRTKLKR
ncbi:MAG: Prophage antirepressor [Candidatus Moranbacteria bacterium GW2011_GWF2_34_56]|nr:MAG: Prophage antirepressor [Candidatus Moranbacteria bacterium GW2011_GWF1_34_10]KKP65211.1 MAG: Prophage antirepressor [Candidatus Moranbacteria bacterium GW2011_GWF2_34_56]HBI17662.1 phage antirepressor protein [Candidatus Moranbacteria bacterium]